MLKLVKKVFFYSFLFFISSFSYAKEKINIVTFNSPPYSYKKNNVQVGFTTEILQYTMDKLSLKTHINELPYKRALRNASIIPNTIIYPLAKTQENEKSFTWIGQVSFQEIHLFKHKNRNDIQINSLDDLKKYKIGIKRGHNLKSFTNNAINNLEKVSSSVNGVSMLQASRIDLLLLDDLEFLHAIEKYNKSQLNRNKVNFNDFKKVFDSSFTKNFEPLYVAINKNSNPTLVKKLKKEYKNSIKQNRFLEVAHWWTEDAQKPMLSVYKKALKKEGYIWIDYTYQGGAGENMQEVMSIRKKLKKRPHVMQTYLGVESKQMYKEAILLDLNKVAKEQKWEDSLPSFINERIKYKGNYFAAPLNIQRVNLVWLSPKVFKASNVSFPSTWEDFFEVSNKIKEKGYIPVSIGTNPWQIGTLFENVVLGIGGEEFYKKIFIEFNLKAFSSSLMIKILKNFRKIEQLTDKKREGRTWVEATRLIAKNKAAMYFMGDWAQKILKEADLKYGEDGYLAIPTPNTKDIFLNNTDVFVFPKVNNSSIIGQNKLAKIIMDKDIQKDFNMVKGSIPSNLKVSIADFDEVSKISFNTFKKGNIVPSFNFRQTASKKLRDEIVSLVCDFFNSDMKEEVFVKKLLKIVKDNKDK